MQHGRSASVLVRCKGGLEKIQNVLLLGYCDVADREFSLKEKILIPDSKQNNG